MSALHLGGCLGSWLSKAAKERCAVDVCDSDAWTCPDVRGGEGGASKRASRL